MQHQLTDQGKDLFFLSIAAAIQKLKSEVDIIACFQTLCGVRKVEELVSKVPAVIFLEDATFVDEMCDWTSAKHWAQWWTRSNHLKMLSNESMEDEILSHCPATTNVVERKNKDCKTDSPNNLKMAMIKVYKFTKLHA